VARDPLESLIPAKHRSTGSMDLLGGSADGILASGASTVIGGRISGTGGRMR
jgi:hypothetical protein